MPDNGPQDQERNRPTNAPRTPPDRQRNASERNASDKERSRQMSRAVSGKEAARNVGRSSGPQPAGQRTAGPRGPQGAPARGGRAARQAAQQQSTRARQAASGRRGQRTLRGRRPPARPGSRTGGGRTGLYIWGSVALVIVIVLVLVLVNVTSSKTKGTDVTPEPVPAKILDEVTHVAPSVFNTVGAPTGTLVTPPKVETTGGAALTYDGKPGILFVGGEFCPFCAAERWAVIASLSRFGTFSGLKTMESSTTDVDPGTKTFTFAGATYKSSYISVTFVEEYGQDKPTGAETVRQRPTKAEDALLAKYDKGTSATSSGSIPFVDFGNKVVVAGASYSPSLLAGLSRATIAADLSHTGNPVARAIVGTANDLSAAVCAIDGGKPASVCTSKGVQAAAQALGLSI